MPHPSLRIVAEVKTQDGRGMVVQQNVEAQGRDSDAIRITLGDLSEHMSSDNAMWVTRAQAIEMADALLRASVEVRNGVSGYID